MHFDIPMQTLYEYKTSLTSEKFLEWLMLYQALKSKFRSF